MTEREPKQKLNSVTYQIYPASFKESELGEQTGIGDLHGIIEKLDYLVDLGVDTIWVSPFFKSPMRDGGYDISDATEINPEFGSINDAKKLISQAHERNLKVIIDFIPNHTSDEHEWFVQSSSSRDNPRSDWYIWSDGIIDRIGIRQPPNNWASVFSKPQLERRKRGELKDLAPDDLTPPVPAWTWCEKRQQYYLHSFASFQPDLNWCNSEVREAMKQQMRFWLNLGVDGFRIDAVNYVGKNLDMPNEAPDINYKEGIDNPYDQRERFHSAGYPATLYAFIDEMIAVLKEPSYIEHNPKIVFEAYMDAIDLEKINRREPEIASSFNFTLLGAHMAPAFVYKMLLDAYYRHLPDGAVGNQVNGNHDKPRLASQLGEQGARAATLFNLMLPGNTFIYNGEELNLTNHEQIPQDRVKDPNGLRDGGRTPMVWDGSRLNAGFSKAPESKIYLPINPADNAKSVAAQSKDPKSTLSLTKAAIKLKKSIDGREYLPHSTVSHEGGISFDVIAYGIGDTDKNIRSLIIRNFAASEKRVSVKGLPFELAKRALSSVNVLENTGDQDLSSIELMPHEAIVLTDLR